MSSLTTPTTTAPSATNANFSVTSPAAATTSEKPKPCCVCKDEKAARDECMLFSRADDPAKDCQTLVGKYKSCMKGFGFDLP